MRYISKFMSTVNLFFRRFPGNLLSFNILCTEHSLQNFPTLVVKMHVPSAFFTCLVVFSVGYCTAQECDPYVVCESQLKTIPDCNGTHDSVECLKRLGADCHGSLIPVEVHFAQQSLVKLFCNDTDIRSEFQLLPDCWGNLEFLKECVVPISASEFIMFIIKFHNPEVALSEDKIEELIAIKNQCTTMTKYGGEKCNTLHGKLLDLILPDALKPTAFNVTDIAI